jgi:quercetin dioxygenase-like cupin family protein
LAKTNAKLLSFVVVAMIAFALGTLRSAKSSAVPQSNAAQGTPTPVLVLKADDSGVMYFPGALVSQTFPKGALLYDGNPERNYRVNVFHRDEAGEAEIHTKDTDIFYILEGSGTFVTGGKVASRKDTAPGEIRAPSMEGGVERTVSKGDVIIIPANVPHWFKAVKQPTTYFGVKVR